LASKFQARVTVLHASSYQFPPYYLESSPSFREEVEAHEELIRDRLKEQTAKILGKETPWETHLSGEHPIDAILEWFKKNPADLLILGSHGQSGAAKLLLGSVSENVLQLVGCPALVVRRTGSDPAQLKKILCPVDLSYSNRDCVRLSAAMTVSMGAQLYLLHATDTQTEPGFLSQEVRDWLPEDVHLKCQSFLVPKKGDAAEQIICWARDHSVDLIVIGARHRPFLEFTTLGRTTERIMRHSPCPVLIVPQRGRPRVRSNV
jgi:nucleotide-binding universal stress UspA family protein